MILFTGLDFQTTLLFKTIHLIRSLVFLYFVSDSPNLTQIQTHHLRIGHVTLIKYKYRHLYEKVKENERKSGFAKFIATYLSSCTCIS